MERNVGGYYKAAVAPSDSGMIRLLEMTCSGEPAREAAPWDSAGDSDSEGVTRSLKSFLGGAPPIETCSGSHSS